MVNLIVFTGFALLTLGLQLAFSRWHSVAVPDERATGLVHWLRNQGRVTSLLLNAGLVLTAAWAGEFWWTVQAWPALTAGGLTAIAAGLGTLLGVGLGLSIGRALTHTDFTLLTND